LTTGTEEYKKGTYPIYTFITSNDKREIEDALLNRSKRVEVPRPTKELFLEILGLPENHYLGYVYDKCPNFSIRQAKQYIEDLAVLGMDFDGEALSQYLNLDALDVNSLADLQRITQMKNSGLEFELSGLERCQIPINSDNQQAWAQIFNENGNEFAIYSDDDRPGELYVAIDTIEQLAAIGEYMDFSGYNNRYRGWFEYSMVGEEKQEANIRWAGNKEANTRFGIKIDNGKMFKIAMNKGKNYVFLDSDSSNTLEQFLPREENVHNSSRRLTDRDAWGER
jgi:hypothetical protein